MKSDINNLMVKMEDELIEKMHSEFEIDEETELKHRAFSALQSGMDLNEASKIYDVPLDLIKFYKKEFDALTGQ